MTMTYVQTETGVRNLAVGDHAGYTVRVATGYDAAIDSYRVHVYLGKRGEGGEEATAFKKLDASDLVAHQVADGFEQGFALAEAAIDRMLAL